jgi:hypothetical protein
MIPDAAERLLPGPSAYEWMVRESMALLVAGIPFVLGLIFALGKVLNAVPIQLFLICWAVAAIVIVTSGLFFGIPGVLKYFRELRAGYTTVSSAAKAYEQRDPFTGETLRQPGQPFHQALRVSRRRRPAKGKSQK